MTNTIGKVAYRATWDARDLTRGMQSTRQQFRAHKKIVEESQSPLQRYNQGLANLRTLVSRFPDLLKHQAKIQADLQREYLSSEAALRKLTRAEQARLDVLLRQERRQSSRAQQRAARMQQEVQREQRMRQRQIEIQRKQGQAERLIDQRRQKAESESVRRHRAALQQRLRDRKRHNEMMRQRIRESVRHIREEQTVLSQSRSGSAGNAGGGLTFGGGLRAGAGLLAVNEIRKAVAAIRDFSSESRVANRELERAEVALTVFSGSMARSQQTVQQMRDLSAQTGVSFRGFTRGAQTMLQFGGTAFDDVIPRMKQIAIVTGGNSERMEGLALAMAQVAAAGKLQGQEVIQMVNAGWSPWEELSKSLNKELPELRDEMRKGNISFQMVADALKAATEEGGRYHGFLEALEGTSARFHDREQAAWEETKTKVGEALEPISNFLSRASTAFAKDISQIVDASFIQKQKHELEEVDKVEERRQERREQLQRLREREAAAFQRMREERRQERKDGLDAMQELRLSVVRDLVSADEFSKFERIVDLLSDARREQAEAEFIVTRNLDGIRGYLQDEVRVELEKVEAMERQAELMEKRKDLLEKSQSTAEKYLSQEQQLVNKLAEIEVARRMGVLSNEQAIQAQKRAAADGIDSKSGNSRVGINANSEEAYQFFRGLQDRTTKTQMKQAIAQTRLQKAMVGALDKANTLLGEIVEAQPGNAG